MMMVGPPEPLTVDPVTIDLLIRLPRRTMNRKSKNLNGSPGRVRLCFLGDRSHVILPGHNIAGPVTYETIPALDGRPLKP
jgi:hypothetical protein